MKMGSHCSSTASEPLGASGAFYLTRRGFM